METNPNKMTPCGVTVIVEIIRRDYLIIMSLYQSAFHKPNSIRIRSQIKVFSIPQRGESSAPFQVDRFKIQTMLGTF